MRRSEQYFCAAWISAAAAVVGLAHGLEWLKCLLWDAWMFRPPEESRVIWRLAPRVGWSISLNGDMVVGESLRSAVVVLRPN